jgi:V8-like Glu-specific endopeptidase
MRRTWSSSQRLSEAFAAVLVPALFLSLFTFAPAHASRNGVEEPKNAFTVGITFKFGSIDQLCSGAMLNPTLVATAGHCAYSPTGETGTGYIFTTPGTALDAAIDPRIVAPKVIKIFTDPLFSPLDVNNVNDIAFLQLDKPILVKSYLKFATRSDLEQLTSASSIAGYGYGRVFETGAGYSIYPRKYTMDWAPIDSTTALSNTFSLTSKTSAPCKGDSGGPIVATLPSGRTVLVGMLSGANNVQGGCGNPSADGLFYIRLTAGYPFLPLIASIYDPAATIKPPAPAKKVTIKCKKGSVTKKVTAVKPVCPKGYKLVK